MALDASLTVGAMSAKTDEMAIRLIGEEVVRLLSLPPERLEADARAGLRLIADLAQWRSIAFGPEPAIQNLVR
ncbi:hypothetical protein [Pseudomonas fluorescens]|uniref:hypothetical protein n=1 Tax=Pseudomonas fluorescens TaxID=294 RepID=UPI001CD2F371|nr:hypothetical protein [Pseudomonas fluorescens]